MRGEGTRKVVTLNLEVTFQGDYYSASEVVGVTMGWIYDGLEDRDNCCGVALRGSSVVESPAPGDD